MQEVFLIMAKKYQRKVSNKENFVRLNSDRIALYFVGKKLFYKVFSGEYNSVIDYDISILNGLMELYNLYCQKYDFLFIDDIYDCIWNKLDIQ